MDRSVIRLIGVGVVAGLAILYYLIPVIYRALRSGVRNRQLRRQESGDAYRPIGLMVVAFFGLGAVLLMGFLAYIGVFEDGRWWAVTAGIGAFVVALLALYGVSQLFRGRRTGALIAFVALGATFGFCLLLVIVSNDSVSAGVVGMVIVALITWYVWSCYSRLQPDSFSERYFSSNTAARVVLLLIVSAALSVGVTEATVYLNEDTYGYNHHYDDEDEDDEDDEDDDYYNYNNDY